MARPFSTVETQTTTRGCTDTFPKFGYPRTIRSTTKLLLGENFASCGVVYPSGIIDFGRSAGCPVAIAHRLLTDLKNVNSAGVTPRQNSTFSESWRSVWMNNL
ncbi:hypothetical protein PI124_g21817 [Phytophthora idaei]|nr:hypothetical protein PI126_g21680 [Phytophthora idaei]KAG3233103.1 hypothetical protein PI124_g21817 [Phytophthora idaei]